MDNDIQAHLADGSILHFPSGTDHSIIQSAVKKQMINSGAQSAISEYNAKTKGSMGQAVEAARPFSVGPAISAGLEMGGAAGSALAPLGPLPAAIGAGVAGVGTAAAVYSGADLALQKIRNYLGGSNEEPSLSDSAKNLAINTLLSKGGEGLMKFFGKGATSSTIEKPFEGLTRAQTEKPEIASQLKEGDRRINPDGSTQVLQKVPLDNIEPAPGNQIDESTVANYQKNGYSVKPELSAPDENGQYEIFEGHHRITADARNGKDQILSWVPESPVDTSKIQVFNPLGDVNRLPPALRQLVQMQPTTAQGLAAIGHKGAAKIVGTFEDIGAPTAKAEAVQNSGQLAQDLVGKTAAKLSGRSQAIVENPEMFARTINTSDLENAYQSTFAQADKQAGMARLVAQSNVGSALDEMTGQIRSIPGPVLPKSTLEKANKIIQDNSNLQLISDQDKPVLKQAYKLIRASDAQFDSDGQLLKAQPISFDEAWQAKKDIDLLSGYGKLRGDVTDTDRQMRGFGATLNQDIEDSLGRWKNDPQQLGLKSWLNAKGIVEERNLTYSPNNSDTPNLDTVISKASSPLPALDKTLADPQSLQRFLNTGEQEFPPLGNGKKNIIESTNARRDMAGYRLIRSWQQGQPSISDQPISVKAIKTAFNDPRFIEQNGQLYNSQTRANINQLLDNAAHVQEKSSAGWIPKVYAVRAGLAIAPALIGLGTGGVERGLEVAGVELGAHAVARLMVNKNVARGIINLAGGYPLELSDRLFAQRMASALQGITISVVDSQGRRVPGTIDKDGNFEKSDPSQQ